jgi:RimJ/RimL family protein N-acetyltransferase
MQEVYGNTYPKKYVYDPAQLREKNAKGEVSSVVAAGRNGTVIGYAALSAYYGYPEIGLIGSMAVAPSCRGQGLAGKLLRHLVACSEGTEFRTLTGGAFTAHPYSQRAMEQEGFSPSAILLGSQPQDLSFRNIAENLSQRESVVFCTRALAREEFGFQYLPENHRKTIREISGKMGIRISADGSGKPGRAPTIIEQTVNAGTGAGLIWIRRTGPDFREAVIDSARLLRARGARVMRMHIDLNDPGANAVVSAAEEAGFIFAGILPGEEGYILLLQHLQDVRIDLRKIHTGGNLCCERLLSYIGAQMKEREEGAKKDS